MVSQAIRFGEFLNHINLYSAQQLQAQLNTPFLFISPNYLSKPVIAHSVEIQKQRQIPLKCIFQEMVTQQKLISSLKLTPEKRKISRKLEGQYQPLLKSINILQTDSKAFHVDQNEIKKIVIENGDTQISNQTAKFSDFNVLAETQDKIKPPTESKKIGCGWSSKAPTVKIISPLDEQKRNRRWWDKCTQLCAGENSTTEMDRYEVQAPQKQLRKLINAKNIPTFSTLNDKPA